MGGRGSGSAAGGSVFRNVRSHRSREEEPVRYIDSAVTGRVCHYRDAGFVWSLRPFKVYNLQILYRFF